MAPRGHVQSTYPYLDEQLITAVLCRLLVRAWHSCVIMMVCE